MCMDLATTGIVLGTKAVAGNLKLYNIRKEKGHYKVPMSSILARIKALEARRRKIDNNLSIMRQLIP